ncbi:type II toxin-antitoxin system VapC family toxin [Desulfobulbus alkaliphilus]|uniref:type II toxin-antitoxin system VapC family toxin n=1 Tax=Desulfobulbus alkaliphilus TaxID=869814 RepID=UPI0019663B5B|nr:type II toxin-antitoxin system VapC family toxin [Desulfobulbus alkaliphilus]MBM9538536.1 type II toxin-antitoxin system VapC family toxin [Desulfobulbus alkaliphilus]
MNIIDSSAWLSFFADEPSSGHFLAPIQDKDSLVVPVITIYEVFKVVLREASENEALQVIGAMQSGIVVDLTAHIAISASRLSLKHKLPMADSIILATAKLHNAIVWTQDIDFKDIPGVKYFQK